ncbi:Gp138 family membrane-puncturing spike protein [Acetobacter indonesiensis]|uniref:Phage protein Gp138 N-terminal domain-containing protein n=1 Tax=Acetobacter indonesiensis TaxID=104101 RepID=A0A252ANP8_9PROT|nr:Gp138 family membrane-puncturing spike protein [Acetobacter indonesiensis]OUI91417.1 hypothetical protein HK17_11505 [Acetobacter indonesiensis]
MDIRERYRDHQADIHVALDSLQSRIWTMLPGVIASFSIEGGSPFARVRLAVKGHDITDAGERVAHDMPILPHCPVIFPRGGGCSLTFPVSAGDECMVIFGARSIDEWWQNGVAQPSYDARKHDLSDGVALVGLTSKARPLSSISLSSVQLRADDGKTVFELNPVQQSVNITAPGGITLAGPVHCTGPVTADDTVTAKGDVAGKGISLSTHPHSGVQSGSSDTGPPK